MIPLSTILAIFPNRFFFPPGPVPPDLCWRGRLFLFFSTGQNHRSVRCNFLSLDSPTRRLLPQAVDVIPSKISCFRTIGADAKFSILPPSSFFAYDLNLSNFMPHFSVLASCLLPSPVNAPVSRSMFLDPFDCEAAHKFIEELQSFPCQIPAPGLCSFLDLLSGPFLTRRRALSVPFFLNAVFIVALLRPDDPWLMSYSFSFPPTWSLG